MRPWRHIGAGRGHLGGRGRGGRGAGSRSDHGRMQFADNGLGQTSALSAVHARAVHSLLMDHSQLVGRGQGVTLQEVFSPRNGGSVTLWAGHRPRVKFSLSSNPGPPQPVTAAKSLNFSVLRFLHLQNRDHRVNHPLIS